MKSSIRIAIATALASLCLCAGAGATVATIKIRHAQAITPTAINDGGQLAGAYVDHAGIDHGFLREPDGTLVTFEVPGGVATWPVGISAAGVITGFYFTAQQQPGAFTRAADGSITTFTVPNGVFATPTGTNAAGWSVGVYRRSADRKGRSFLRDPSGATTEFVAPHAKWGTAAREVNSSQTIAGEAYIRKDNSTPLGFVRTVDGTITEFGDLETGFYVVGINDAGTIAGSDVLYSEGLIRTSDGTITAYRGPNGALSTRPADINNSGTIVGSFMDTDYTYHGFIRAADGTIAPFDPIRAVTSAVTVINNSGVIAGTYENKKSGIQYGFVGTP